MQTEPAPIGSYERREYVVRLLAVCSLSLAPVADFSFRTDVEVLLSIAIYGKKGIDE